MEYIQIDKIIAKDNVREDYGDIEALTISIKEEGVKQPLILTDKYVLVDGFRRLHAAKKAGKAEVPYVIRDDSMNAQEITIEQVIHGVHSKNITPMEEAAAYNLLATKHKLNTERIGLIVGKPEHFVKKRMLLTECCKEVAEALQEGRIGVAHAEILAQLTPAQQKVTLQIVVEYKYSAKTLAETLRWNQKVNLEGFEFKKAPQKGLLESLGQELETQGWEDIDTPDTRKLTDTPAFKKEVAEYLQSQRQILREKNIVVFDSPEALKKSFPKAKQIARHDQRYAEAAKTLGKKDTHAVAVYLDDFGQISRQLYCVDPVEEKKQKAEKITLEEQKAADKVLEKQQGESLGNDVAVWTTDWLQKELSILPMTRHQIEVLHLAFSVQGNQMTDVEEKMSDKLGFADGSFEVGKDIEKLFKLKTDKLHAWQEEAAREFVRDAHLSVLRYLVDEFGFDIKKKFQLTTEFLEPYTKKQLFSLCKELGWKDCIKEAAKREEVVQEMLATWKKGDVPKIIFEVEADYD